MELHIKNSTITSQLIIHPKEWFVRNQRVIGYKQYGETYSLKVDNYDLYQILCVLEGNMTIHTNGRTIQLNPEHIVLFRLGSSYAINANVSSRALSLSICGDYQDRFIGRTEILRTDKRMEKIISIIEDCLDFREMVDLKLLDVMSSALLEHTQALSVKSRRLSSLMEIQYSDDIAERATSLLEKSVMSGKQVHEILSGFGLSYRQISRHVKKRTGMPPKQYFMNVRMERATELLKDEMNSIALVSYDLGFSSVQHFSRQFKLYNGVTPGDYRKSVLQ
jgi:AraC-like DNA-binding protein/mannose-6-phosphate isomerase-like protein (cupin superfamily)